MTALTHRPFLLRVEGDNDEDGQRLGGNGSPKQVVHLSKNLEGHVRDGDDEKIADAVAASLRDTAGLSATPSLPHAMPK